VTEAPADGSARGVLATGVRATPVPSGPNSVLTVDLDGDGVPPSEEEY